LVIGKAGCSEDQAVAVFNLDRVERKAEHLQQAAVQFGANSSRLTHRDIRALPGNRIVDGVPQVVLRMMEKARTLGETTEIRQGLATTDNARFIRYWWDVLPETIGQRWFPYVKGAGSERWHGPVRTLVDWEDNGLRIKNAVIEAYPYLKGKSGWVVKNERYYFREGLTFSLVNSRSLAVRLLPPGCIFDVAGSAIFASPEHMDFLLAYLNSSLLQAIARLLNPTINFQVGDLRRLPVFDVDDITREALAKLARHCCNIKQEATASDETAWFNATVSNTVNYSKSSLAALEAEIDRLVLASFLKSSGASIADSLEVERWVNSSRPEPEVSVEFPDEGYSVLYSALKNFTDQHGACVLEKVESIIANRLGLNNSGSSVIKALGTFNAVHVKRFKRSPLIHVVVLEAPNQLLIFSTQWLRKIIALQENLSPSNFDCTENSAGQDILRKVADNLAPISDWTGRDVAEILKLLV
jgi:hypothetical protein